MGKVVSPEPDSANQVRAKKKQLPARKSAKDKLDGAKRGEGQKAVWQWFHTTGWRDYPVESSQKIEAAWSRGESQLIIAHGKHKEHLTTIDFTSMMQHSTATGGSRAI